MEMERFSLFLLLLLLLQVPESRCFTVLSPSEKTRPRPGVRVIARRTTTATAFAANDDDNDNDNDVASAVLRSLWRRAAVPVPAALLDADDLRPPTVYPGYESSSEPSRPANAPVLYLAYLAAPLAALLLGGDDLGNGGALPYLLTSVTFVTLSAAVRVPQWPAAAAAVVVGGSVTGSFGESGLAFAAGIAVAALGALGNLEQDPQDAWEGLLGNGLNDDDEVGGSGRDESGSERLRGATFEDLDRLEVWDEQQQQRRRSSGSSSGSSGSSSGSSSISSRNGDDDQESSGGR